MRSERLGLWFDRWRKAAKLAIGEWLFTAILATTPFSLGVLVYVITCEINGANWNVGQAILSTIGKGELLVFSVTFLAQAMWTVAGDPEGSKKFPGRVMWILAILVIVVPAAASFGIWRATGYSSPGFSWLVYLTLILAASALLTRFVILATHYSRMPIGEQTYNQPTNEFAEAYEKHRGEKNDN